MKLHIVIPVRPPEEGKSRLARVLDPPARSALVQRMFRHVLSVALAAVGGPRCTVVSRSPELLQIASAAGANALGENGRGLNLALEQASAALGEMPVLALSADLPLLAPADLEALAAALAHADAIAATDRAGRGTNALLLRRAGLIDYAFGDDSLAGHRALAKAAQIRFAVLHRPGLAADLDEPADLVLAERLSLSAA